MKSGCAKVGLELGKMEFVEFFDCLELQDDMLPDNEVYASSTYEFSFKVDADRYLRLERD